MAKILSQAGIETANTVEAWHVTQSIDAFTGAEAYDITLSGSLVVTGSITGSLFGTASWAQNSHTSSYAPNIYNSNGTIPSGSIRIVSNPDSNISIQGGNSLGMLINGGTTLALNNATPGINQVILYTSTGLDQYFGLQSINNTNTNQKFIELYAEDPEQNIFNSLKITLSGSSVTGSLIAPRITGSLLGTASFASTASFLNPLNQSQVTINGTTSINEVTYYPNITYNDLTVGTEITVLTIPITNYHTTTVEIIAAAGVTDDVTNISSTLGGNLIGAAKRDSGGVSIMGQTSSSFRSGFTNDTRFGLSAGSGVINVWVRSESLATRWTLGVKSITVFNPIP